MGRRLAGRASCPVSIRARITARFRTAPNRNMIKPMTTTTRVTAKQLVDQVPEDELGQCGVFLQWLIGGRTDAVLLAFASAPVDHEELTEDERTALDGAATARFYSHEDAAQTAHEAAKRRLGIS